MININGIILILSCKKHKNTRLKKFGPKKNIYNNWIVIKVIGDLFLEKEYVLNNNILYIKCEDSYLHLLKKLSLSIKYLYKIFNIKEGILRCGDDLIFNEENLNKFLKSNKYDYYGKAYCNKDYKSNNINLLKNTIYDDFMLKYYKNNINELSDKYHGIYLTINKLKKFLIRPKIWGASGVIYYISNKSCNIIINTMENINYNIFHLDKFTNSYPYIIEDVGITFIMYYNKIQFINNPNFFDTKNSIVKHTNYNK